MKRNYGVDCLRILAMFMVAVLHVLGQGGVLANTEPLSLKYWTAWFFEIACYCAVNCFALISGYVMYQLKPKISRIMKLWFQTAFYTVVAVAVFLIFKPEAVGETTFIYTLLPITSARYWYISAYFGMLILLPLWNTVLQHTDEKTLGIILLSAFAVFCVLPTAIHSNPYGLIQGYSMIWLSLLYLAGGYMHKYDILKKIKPLYAWVTIAVMLTVSLLTKFVIEIFFQSIPFIHSYNNAFISFTSPTIVLIAVCLFAIFSNRAFKPGFQKLIGFISPGVLGVYLFHVNPLVWDHCMKNLAKSFVNYNCAVMICLILLTAILIFVIGIAIDMIRIQLFKILKIDQLCARADEKMSIPSTSAR